jgi:hypothetical protein
MIAATSMLYAIYVNIDTVRLSEPMPLESLGPYHTGIWRHGLHGSPRITGYGKDKHHIIQFNLWPGEPKAPPGSPVFWSSTLIDAAEQHGYFKCYKEEKAYQYWLESRWALSSRSELQDDGRRRQVRDTPEPVTKTAPPG